MRGRKIIGGLLAALLLSVPSLPAEPLTPEITQLVEDICDQGNNYTRWTGPVPVAFVGGSPAVIGRFQAIGGYLNRIMQGSDVRLDFPAGVHEPQDGQITVLLDFQENLKALAEKYQFEAGPRPYQVWRDYGPDNQLRRVYLFLDASAIDPSHLDRMILRLWLDGLGPGGHSSRFTNSVFARGFINAGSDYQLLPLEQTAFYFAMRYVQPNDQKAAIDRQLTAHWQEASDTIAARGIPAPQ